MKMTETKWDESKAGHIVRIGSRTEKTPYRFRGKVKKVFVAESITKQCGGIQKVLEMLREGYEIGEVEL